MTVGEWVRSATERLSASGSESARLEAQVLAAHVLDRDRTWVLVHTDEPMPSEDAEVVLARRIEREPLAYILGWREFYGRRFDVDRRVLIPRQETEVLVETALSHAPQGATVLDVGTGSGCIAVTLKLERPDLRVSACDVSADALQVAETNAQRLGAALTFYRSDLYAEVPGSYDLIVSNPPYIGRDEPLEAEVALHEPELALYGGQEGDEIIRRLSRGARARLLRGGELMFEFGYRQKKSVTSILKSEGFDVVSLKRDLAGMDRIAIARTRQDKTSI